MGSPLGHHRGGIAGLLVLPAEDWAAIEARLLDRGFTLKDIPHRVSWRAVMSMVQNPWTAGDYVTALAVDTLRLLWWAKTADGANGENPPQPIPRPGDAARKAKETAALIAAAIEVGLLEVAA